jgi:serine/threonine protein kinase
VHRDIKPDNVLVLWRRYDDIFVKFGDFGLAKDDDNLSTLCGTATYLAPEVYENMYAKGSGFKERLSYTAAVDVWSLGVMVYGFLCPFPQWEAAYESGGTKWAQRLMSVFNKDYQARPDEFRCFLLTTMVVMSPQERWPAVDCHETAQDLSTPGTERGATPSMASLDGEEQATIRCGAEGTTGQAEEAQTVLWQPLAADEAAMLPGAHQFHRSGAPAPRSVAAPNLAATRHTTTASVSRSDGRYIVNLQQDLSPDRDHDWRAPFVEQGLVDDGEGLWADPPPDSLASRLGTCQQPKHPSQDNAPAEGPVSAWADQEALDAAYRLQETRQALGVDVTR